MLERREQGGKRRLGRIDASETKHPYIGKKPPGRSVSAGGNRADEVRLIPASPCDLPTHLTDLEGRRKRLSEKGRRGADDSDSFY